MCGKLRVFVSGLSGNVGSKVARAVLCAGGMELVGGFAKETGVDIAIFAGLEECGIKSTDNLEDGIKVSKPDVVVDFTSATIIMRNIEVYVSNGVDAVIGTTGFTEQMLSEVEEMVKKGGLRFVVVSNFGLGVNLVAEFLKTASKYYSYAVITDRHHYRMANAPSGTASLLAEQIGELNGIIESEETIGGVLGGERKGVRIHSERLPYPSPFSEHTIRLGRANEIVEITITDFSSDVYIDGVMLSLRKIKRLPPGSMITNLMDIQRV